MWFLHVVSPCGFSLWFLPVVSPCSFSLWFLLVVSPCGFSVRGFLLEFVVELEQRSSPCVESDFLLL